MVKREDILPPAHRRDWKLATVGSALLNSQMGRFICNGCKRDETYHLAEVAAVYRLPPEMTFYELVSRVYCQHCGSRDVELLIASHDGRPSQV